MFLKKLHINAFRNIDEILLTVEENVNIFLGKNGEGKTSILEAIAMLSIPKSFRTSTLSDLITFEKDYTRVIGLFENDNNDDVKIEFGYQVTPRVQRALKINDVKKSTKNYLKGVYVSTFVPEDLYLLDLGPSKRREYINRILSKLDFMYLDNLSRYEKALKGRNALLKRVNEGLSYASELEVWDAQIIKSGALIIKRRLELLFEMSHEIATKYSDIAESDDKIEVGYYSKIHDILNKESVLKNTFETENIEMLFEKALTSRIERDIRTKVTSVGPHRDDIQFFMNGKNMESFASRGEKRTLLLSLKVTELEVVKLHLDSKPLLLLDDVFSELDNDRQTKLLELISPYQTFITTNSPEHFESYNGTKKIWNIRGGKVVETVAL